MLLYPFYSKQIIIEKINTYSENQFIGAMGNG
jgi:hypothetical protein